MRRFGIIGLICQLGALWATGQGVLRNEILAIVNDSIITRQDIESYTALSVERINQSLRDQPNLLRERFLATMDSGREDLIKRQLVLDDFKSAGGMLSETYIEDEIRDRIRRQFGDRATLIQSLKKENMNFETFRQQTRERIIYDFMRRRNVSSAIIVSPAKIESYYTSNLEKYRLEDQIKLRVIVLNQPSGSLAADNVRLALEVLGKVREGVSFAEMASIYSEGSTRQQTGDWGWVERSKLSPGLADVAFGLKAGEMSDVIGRAPEPNRDYWIYHYDDQARIVRARKYSEADAFLEERSFEQDPEAAQKLPQPSLIYLMRVEGRRDARVRPLDEMREEIEQELLLRESARLEKKWIDRLAQKYFVVRF